MDPWLTVVTPVFNEAAVVAELVARIDATVASTGVAYEIVVVDDGSTDATPRILAGLEGSARLAGRLRVVRPANNVGQFQATRLGLAAARGQWVAVLDGDLQDPPEVLVSLIARARVPEPAHEVIFAVKTSRRDPAWFRAGRAGFVILQRLLSRAVPPTGAGSYCVMTARLAAAVAAVTLRDANLAPVLAVLGATMATVPYAKAQRQDGSSRVGPAGLLREALGSLAITGALGRLLGVTAALLLGAGGALLWGVEALGPAAGLSALTAGGLSMVGAIDAQARARAALQPAVGRPGGRA